MSPGQSIYIDSGSTMCQVANALRRFAGLRILTNDLQVASRLGKEGRSVVSVTGGELLDNVFTLTGQRALDAIRSRTFDVSFIGAEAIHPVAGVTNINLVEVELKRAAAARTQRSVLVADGSKFGLVARFPVCTIDEIDTLLTDVEIRDAALYGDRLTVVSRPDSEPSPQPDD